MKDFKESTKAHILGLSKRDYSPNDNSLAPEYILMFIPIESCYSLMFCDDNTLWDYAWKNKIMPVSPSTLLASLKIINSFLVVNRQNQNAFVKIPGTGQTPAQSYRRVREDQPYQGQGVRQNAGRGGTPL